MSRLLTLALLLFVANSFAQEAIKPRPSPLTVASTRFKDCYVKIIYSQPHKKGREQ